MHGGFSLPEIIITVAVIGVLASITLPVVIGVIPSSQASVASRNLNLLNGAVVAFNQNNHELALASDAGTSDEMAVIRSLQFVPPPVPGTSLPASAGAPYYEPMANIQVTSDPTRYRAQWNGKVFRLVSPTTAGAGIDLIAIAGRAASAPTYPSGYKTVGAP